MSYFRARGCPPCAQRHRGLLFPPLSPSTALPPSIPAQDLASVITGGTATYAITYNFIPLSPTVDDLCADQKDDLCPLKEGHHHSESHSTFPSGLSGTLKSTITWKDTSGAQILCLEWTVKA